MRRHLRRSLPPCMAAGQEGRCRAAQRNSHKGRLGNWLPELPQVVQVQAVDEGWVGEVRKVEAQRLPVRGLKGVDVVDCKVGWRIDLSPIPSLEVDHVQPRAQLRLPVE